MVSEPLPSICSTSGRPVTFLSSGSSSASAVSSSHLSFYHALKEMQHIDKTNVKRVSDSVQQPTFKWSKFSRGSNPDVDRAVSCTGLPSPGIAGVACGPVACVCLHGRSNDLPACLQHLPPVCLLLKTCIILGLANRLWRNRSPHCDILLSTCVLWFLV